MTHHFTAVIHEESLSTGEAVFVALCPEVDVASQGSDRAEALANLKDAVEGFLEVASPQEIEQRLREGASVTPLEVAA
jgi:predicted RNase H-like HicB family nuclease